MDADALNEEIKKQTEAIGVLSTAVQILVVKYDAKLEAIDKSIERLWRIVWAVIGFGAFVVGAAVLSVVIK